MDSRITSVMTLPTALPTSRSSSGLDPVRRRPGMYTDTTRPNHLAHEVIDNSVDEALAGHCDLIEVTLYKDGSLQVDRQRPRHAGGHPPEGKGQRRRADPHAPACRRQVLRHELQVLRRPARRGRVGGQRAVEAAGVLGAARRQGIQHRLSQRQGVLEARGGRHRRPEATPAPRVRFWPDPEVLRYRPLRAAATSAHR